MLHVVITTIQKPTECVLRLANCLSDGKGHLVIAGDTKGPDSFDLSSVGSFAEEQLTFLDIDAQLNSGFSVAQKLPTKHYCRKNIGYLQAMRNGAECIYETDDDNAPLDSWKTRQSTLPEDCRFVSREPSDDPTWINVYQHFTEGLIWPRGLPLDQIREPSTVSDQPSATIFENTNEKLWCPIQQGLADGAPDVDAIWRLVLDDEFNFRVGDKSIVLAPGQWCPFNTQTTWWWPEAYPLMYVPSYCSFRMCDIWKSFVAQRCIWELDTGIAFHASEVVQERNPHNLMRDFSDEVPGYEQNNRLATILESTELKTGIENVPSNLRSCYEALVAGNIFPEKELELVNAWIDDVAMATGNRKTP